jgi:hypothetical protein
MHGPAEAGSPNSIFWYLFDFLLQVTEVDQLPKIMCGECTYKLDLISDFREKAYKTETQLLSKVDVNKVKAEVYFFVVSLIGWNV